jgi:uncharacterized DUF497 family protein
MEPFWDEQSRNHIAKHGVTTQEVGFLLKHSRPPFPEEIGENKHLVQGQTEAGRFLQVIFVYRPIDTLDWESLAWEDRVALADEGSDEIVYVVHARDLTDSEKRALRRRLG